MSDLAVEAFLALRDRFFAADGRPVRFALRDKLKTQDDPFDEFIGSDVLATLPGTNCVRATGPLITPDLVLFRSEKCERASRRELADDIDRIVGIEVKKLERTKQGAVARASGLDYNTTPPCGRIRIYDADEAAVEVRGFYLFVCVESAAESESDLRISGLVLIDGNALNEDFDLYLRVVGERQKRIGLGTYGDGADRDRPMLIFANPLGTSALDHQASLIHPRPDLDLDEPRLRSVYEIERTIPSGGSRRFFCYRIRPDVPSDWTLTTLRDPFPTPTRDTRTRPRGRFRLPFRVEAAQPDKSS